MKNATILAGETFKTNNGGECVVIEVRGCYEVLIEHLDEYKHRATVTASQLRGGRVKNPYRPRIHGVGFVGFGRHKASISGRDTRPYVAWTRMIERAYCRAKQVENPTYAEASVCPEWHNFQNFAEWYDSQPFKGAGYQLDKDILVKGNKHYCPSTCRLVPEKINKLLTGSDSRRGGHPMGVNFYAGKFCAHCSTDGRKNYIGRFGSAIEAFNAYKKYRENYIKRCAEDMRDLMPAEVYGALISWDISIED